MQSAIIEASGPSEDEVSRHIMPSATLDAGARLDIYRRMYLHRFEEVLASDVPGLRHHLGDARFEALCRDYMRAHPSRHPDLGRLIAHLPAFVEHWGGLRRRSFAADLARVECLVAQLHTEPFAPALDAGRAASIAPHVWDRVRLRLAPTLRLLSLRHDVGAWLRAFAHDHRLPSTARCDTRLALYRTEWSVVRRPLSRAEAGALDAVSGGATLFEAFVAVARGRGKPSAERFARWVASWLEEGLVADLELDGTDGATL